MIDISLMLKPNNAFSGHLLPAPSNYVYTIDSHICVILLHTFRLAINNYSHSILQQYHQTPNTVKPVCNDHLYNKSYYLWFLQ